jgi:branched-chain amino acid transport system ATP-binding protein
MKNVSRFRDLQVNINQSHILHGVSFDVPENKVTALLGRNGVGNPRLLKPLWASILELDRINYNGQEILNSDTYKNRTIWYCLYP